jgi:hypothetical protein
MHAAFQVPYVYDYITKLCRRQAEIIQNHENSNVRNIGQGETPLRKYKTCGVVDDIRVQMTTTLISLDPWLIHHFIASTNIYTFDH